MGALNNILRQYNQIIHKNFQEVKKKCIFFICVTCITLLRTIWIPNPKLHAPKKKRFHLYFHHTKYEPDISSHARKKWGVKIQRDFRTPCSLICTSLMNRFVSMYSTKDSD